MGRGGIILGMEWVGFVENSLGGGVGESEMMRVDE